MSNCCPSHTSAADAICRKQWEPDAFYLHSLDQVENQFALMRSPLFLIQFPIDVEDSSESMSTQEILGDFKISGDKKHIVNIFATICIMNTADIVMFYNNICVNFCWLTILVYECQTPNNWIIKICCC